jgi:hypothetical protein
MVSAYFGENSARNRDFVNFLTPFLLVLAKGDLSRWPKINASKELE